MIWLAARWPAGLRTVPCPPPITFDAASSSFGATNERNAFELGDAMLPRSRPQRRRPGCSLIWCRARRRAPAGRRDRDRRSPDNKLQTGDVQLAPPSAAPAVQ
jgi:hypothetical protein